MVKLYCGELMNVLKNLKENSYGKDRNRQQEDVGVFIK